MIKLNGYPIKPTIFPDGTSQVWKIPEHYILDKGNVVEWEFENEAEINGEPTELYKDPITDPRQAFSQGVNEID